MIFTFFILLLLSITYFLIWCHVQKVKYKSLDNIPGPKPYPIIGNLLDIGTDSVEFFYALLRLSKLYKPTAKFSLGPNQLFLLSTDPDLMEFILKSTKYVEKPADYKNLKCFLHNGLLTASGSLWHKRRKLINTAFYPDILKSNNESFNDRASALIERLSKRMKEGDINIYAPIAYFTTEVICETSMGVSVNEENSLEYSEYYKHINTVTEIIMRKIFSIWKRFDILFPLSSDYKVLQKIINYGEGITRFMIEKRRQKLIEDKKLEESTDYIGIKKRKIFMDLVLSSTIDDKPLSDNEILEEVNTMIIAGIETTATLITFTLYELSRNIEIQEKVVKELKEIFGTDKNYRPSIQDYNNMVYLELVLKETLRLYPAIPFFGRQLQEDVNYNDTIIPKDTTLYFLVYEMHRREDFFPDAEKFDPERFVTGRVSSHPYSYLPFSAGPRKCIGQKYAMLEAKCALSRLLMHYEILPPALEYNLKLLAQIMLRPSPGVFIQLQKRQFN